MKKIFTLLTITLFTMIGCGSSSGGNNSIPLSPSPLTNSFSTEDKTLLNQWSDKLIIDTTDSLALEKNVSDVIFTLEGTCLSDSSELNSSIDFFENVSFSKEDSIKIEFTINNNLFYLKIYINENLIWEDRSNSLNLLLMYDSNDPITDNENGDLTDKDVDQFRTWFIKNYSSTNKDHLILPSKDSMHMTDGLVSGGFFLVEKPFGIFNRNDYVEIVIFKLNGMYCSGIFIASNFNLFDPSISTSQDVIKCSDSTLSGLLKKMDACNH